MYKEKLCYIESCKKPFIPTSGNQLYCPQCGEKVKESKNKIRWRNKSRIRSNYKEYTRICKNPNCNKEFKTFYKKKIYCGSDICEKERIRIKNHNINIRRNKDYLIKKGRLYYKNHKKLICENKAIKYRQSNPNAIPYIPGRVYKHDLDYVSSYLKEMGYNLLSNEYINNRSKIILQCPYGHIWETTFHNFKDSHNRCFYCYINNNYVSKPEQKLRDYFKEKIPDINVIYNDRKQIKPLELDFYFPKHKLAIEVCGLYWHSETFGGKSKDYHYKKMMACFDKGIRLLTVFEDELEHKFDNVVSIIFLALGKTNNELNADNCNIKFIDKVTAKDFVNKYSLYNNIHFDKFLGMYYKNKIVGFCGIVILKNILEIKEICFKPFIKINNAYNKFFKEILKNINTKDYKIIKAYCDMRYANIFDSVYEKLGFNLINNSKYNFHYFKHGKRFFCNKYNNNYQRIWDCGYKVYSYKLI